MDALPLNRPALGHDLHRGEAETPPFFSRLRLRRWRVRVRVAVHLAIDHGRVTADDVYQRYVLDQGRN